MVPAMETMRKTKMTYFDPENHKNYNDEAEDALLASIIIEPELFRDIKLEPLDFYDNRNRLIFTAIQDLVNNSGNFDTVLITNWLEKKGKLADIGGPSYIARLITSANGFHVLDYALIIKDHSRRRQLLDRAGKLAKLANREKIDDFEIDALIIDLNNLKGLEKKPQSKTMDRWTVSELYDVTLPEPNWAVPGLIPEGLTLLGGRPKVGKSWLALQIAHSISTGGIFFEKG
jgi:replicative DNA helicase